MSRGKWKEGGALILTIGLFAGCGSGSGSSSNQNINPGNQNPETVLIDATAGGIGAPATDPNNKYAYLNLATGQVVDLTDADAKNSEDWDIAFKRSNIKLNSGISGPKEVAAYYAGNNTDAYDANGTPILGWFENATADTELADFENVTSADIPADTEFETDRVITAIEGDGTPDGWWLYDVATNVVSANPANWWIVRLSGGDTYAKFHVTDIVRDQAAQVRRITLEWYYQGAADAGFGATVQSLVVEIPLAGGVSYVDVDTATQNSDTSLVDGWDLKVEFSATERTYRISLNGGVSGTGRAAVFGPVTDPDQYASGATPNPVPLYFTDSAGGVFVDSSWYAYNLKNDNKLWPNYRVYLIKSKDMVYKFQVLSYYHPQAATSAWYSVRFEKVN